MPLDTSIALGVKPVEQPDWMSLAGKFASLQTNQLEQEKLRAQIPGAEALTRQQQAAAAAAEIDTRRKQWAQDHAQDPKYVLPDGTFDTETFSQDQAKAGDVLGAQASASGAADVRSKKAMATSEEAKAFIEARKAGYQGWLSQNSGSFVEPDEKTPGQTTVNFTKMAKAAAQAGYGLEAGELIQKQLSLDASAIQNATSKVQQAATVIGAARNAKGLFGTSLENTPQGMRQQVAQGAAAHLDEISPGMSELVFGKREKDGTFNLDDKKIKEMKRSSMTPAEQIGVDNAVALTHSQLETEALNRAALTGQPGVMGADLRTQMGAHAAKLESGAGLLRAGQAAAEELSKDRLVGTLIGDKLSSWMAAHLDDPRVGAIQAANGFIEARGGKSPDVTQGWGIIGGRFKAEAGPLESEAKEYRGNSQGIPAKKGDQPAVPTKPAVSPAKAEPAPATEPKAGDVVRGWRFKGGDRRDKKNWEKQ